MARKLILIVVIFLLIIPHQLAWASVELSFFNAFFDQAGIRIEWKTTSETNNSGFYVLRSTSVNGVYERVIFVLSESVHGEGVHYIFVDDTIERGQVYYYKLEIVDLNMNSEIVGPVSAAYGVSTWTPTPSLTQTPGGVSQASRTPTATVKSSLTPTSGAALNATATNVYPYPLGTATTLPLSTLTPTSPFLQQSPTMLPGTSATLSLSSTITTTIEAVPTSELLFPAPLETSTPTPTKTITTAEPSLAVTPEDTQSGKLSGKSYILLSIPIMLWIALAAFLTLFVRKVFVGSG